jgi:hypothetical protein
VTAHTREGDVADYANVGRNVRISAPGGGFNTWLPERSGSPRGIMTTGNSGTTRPAGDITSSLQGTSMAVPQVAGVLALLAPLKPTFAMSTLEAIVADSARVFPLGSYCQVNPDKLAPGFCGAGLLDAARAVQAVEAAPLQSADLSVEQRAPNGDLRPGQTVKFTVILRNAGPEAVLGARASFSPQATQPASKWGPQAVLGSGAALTQVFGPGLDVVTVDAPFPITRSFSGWSAALPSLAVNETATVQVTAIVRASVGSGLSSVTSINGTYPDPANSNNQDTVFFTVAGAPLSEDSGSDGGGGCTAAPNGQADASLLLLALAGLGLTLWRRRR